MGKILFLTQVLPYPPHSGAKIRAYYVLRQLARQHEVTLLSFVREDDKAESVEHLEGFCEAVRTVPMQRSLLRNVRAVLKAGLTGQSVIIVRDEVPEMHQALHCLLAAQAFDVIHADQTSMAQYALHAQRLNTKTFNRPHIPLVLDAHNALYRIPERMARHESNPLKRWVFQREARVLARYEVGTYDRFDHVVFVTNVDQEEILQRTIHTAQVTEVSRAVSVPKSVPPSHPTTSVIPICVDTDDKPLVARRDELLAVTHLGTMFWPPNVEGVLWFAREVFPRVLAQIPEARFVVVGKNPPREVQDLTLQVRNVQVTGYVPDPEPYLAETGVFIVPLRAGGGMRVKIVDAWSWGLPIVSTSIGAEGTEIEKGENILIGDTPEALAEAVVRVLKEPALGERLRMQGRAWVEEHYHWRNVYTMWEKLYTELISENST
ncbi:MAG: glycosyltransferase [Anaerolineae bacterium]|nr:glycosyltransferase [Anaerolineae bacterium]